MATVECIAVRYDKGERRERSPSIEEGITLSYSQKDKSFKSQFEWRVVVRVPLRLDLPDHIELQLPAPIPYAELVNSDD